MKDELHLKLAYKLGKTVRKASNTVGAVKRSVKSRLRHKKTFESPILNEIKAIADISGLTSAIQEMNEISLKHSRHPVISHLISRIEQLSANNQEMLSRKFIYHLQANPYFSNSLHSMPMQSKMTEEDCQNISDAFIESIFYTLEDVGITPREKKFLQKFSTDMARPLNDLVQLYLAPKKFSQKVKRLWRMQRIFIKLIKLIHLANKYEGPIGEFNAHTKPKDKFMLEKL